MDKRFAVIIIAGLGSGLFILYSLLAPYYYSLNATEEMELKIHELVNESRNKAGVLPLQYDSKLAEIARAHSQDMIDRDYYSHKTPEGLDPTGRALNADYNCSKDLGFFIQEGIGENIARPSRAWISIEHFVEDVVRIWDESQEHRENMNDITYEREGIGIAFSDLGYAYVTQNLC